MYHNPNEMHQDLLSNHNSLEKKERGVNSLNDKLWNEHGKYRMMIDYWSFLWITRCFVEKNNLIVYLIIYSCHIMKYLLTQDYLCKWNISLPRTTHAKNLVIMRYEQKGFSPETLVVFIWNKLKMSLWSLFFF